MAKKIVDVDEDTLKGMIIGDMPVFGRKQERQQATQEVESSAPKVVESSSSSEPAMAESSSEQIPQNTYKPRGSYRSRRKSEEPPSQYRERFLVVTANSMRSQTYINKEVYDRIKRFLPVIASEVSISSYISNILVDHLEQYAEDINSLYDKAYAKPL